MNGMFTVNIFRGTILDCAVMQYKVDCNLLYTYYVP